GDAPALQRRGSLLPRDRSGAPLTDLDRAAAFLARLPPPDGPDRLRRRLGAVLGAAGGRDAPVFGSAGAIRHARVPGLARLAPGGGHRNARAQMGPRES